MCNGGFEPAGTVPACTGARSQHYPVEEFSNPSPLPRPQPQSPILMPLPENTLLGRAVDHEPAYAPSILMPIPRAAAREALGIHHDLPFAGVDRWTGFELGWLEPGGKPRVAVMRAQVPADSPNLIESKSFKLYLNSYARERLEQVQAVQSRIATDLTTAAGAPVHVELLEPRDWPRLAPGELSGTVIDELPIEVETGRGIDTSPLRSDCALVVDESLVSHLLKSNCPVTGQPDWASVVIDYRGPAIDRAGLLRYLVSFRDVREFHEQCVERIYLDLARHCAPEWLAVEARYTRRGGLDINPRRVTRGQAAAGPERRHWRQ